MPTPEVAAQGREADGVLVLLVEEIGGAAVEAKGRGR